MVAARVRSADGKVQQGHSQGQSSASFITTEGCLPTSILQGSRLDLPRLQAMYGATLAENAAKADKLGQVAKELGCSTTQLALAWCAANTNVSTVILGATSVAQLDENLDAFAFVDKITPEIRAKIDAIAEFVPTPNTESESWLAQVRGKWL